MSFLNETFVLKNGSLVTHSERKLTLISMELLGKEDGVILTINGKLYRADNSNVQARTSLNTFIRDVANLKGTKYMCKEGGCGSCVVTIQSTHPATGETRYYAVNSCLVPVLSCHGQAITTIEGVGNKSKGYHKAQAYLAGFNGSQCGFCSPGQVMNMYSLLKSNDELSMAQIENSFGGHICRCTGYRPILDAFKALAADSTCVIKQKAEDIEDLLKNCDLTSCQKKCTKPCLNRTESLESFEQDFVELALAPTTLRLNLTNSGGTWYKVATVSEIFQVFDLIGPTSYMLVAGNTAQGVYPVKNPPSVYIDINSVAELKDFTTYDEVVEVGANLTLNDFIQVLKDVSKEHHLLFGYGQVLADHLDLVAHIAVRNIGTIAGNLSIKHQHPEFPSDVFLLLETIGARITLRDITGSEKIVRLTEYLATDMYRTIITKVHLPALSTKHYVLRTYKIMPRHQNVHALVNAGFLFRINMKTMQIEDEPSIVYGNINPQFVHARHAERFLTQKNIRDPKVIKKTLTILVAELDPNFDPVEASPQYRQKLAVSLFYRYVLSLDPKSVPKRQRSGGINLMRPLSSGQQAYDSRKKTWPVGQPLPKLEGVLQTSGEAEFTNDIPKFPDEVYGALVLTDRANNFISHIDASKALSNPDVIAFFSAKDIPGINTFINRNYLNPEDEELFCSGRVIFAGQCVGMVVAKTQDLANEAAQSVEVIYQSSSGKPLLTIEDVLKSGDKSRITQIASIRPTKQGTDVAFKITGEHKMEGQLHYTIEPQSALVVPSDDGLDVYSATQWMHNNQGAISRALGIPFNSVNMKVKRLGGAFGSKITRSSIVSTACAVASHLLQKPVRMVLDLETNFRVQGSRLPNLAKYEVGVDKKGKIQYLIVDFYENFGSSLNDNIVQYTIEGIKNCYDPSTFNVRFYAVRTDIPSNTWMRAPGTLEGIGTIEQIMEHVAQVTKQNSLSVRGTNYLAADCPSVNEMIATTITSSNFNTRITAVDKYNKTNRWKKRGISLIPMKFALELMNNYYAMVSIYCDDGTVAVTTGGVEVGQGLHTKVIQVCAYELGIDVSFVKIKPTMNITAPNNMVTGASVTTDSVCYAAMICCQTIQERLRPLREKMKNPKWVDLLKMAQMMGINLNASHMYSLTDPLPKNYPIYGVTVLEVEVDVMTGQYEILRVDIEEDCGDSLNPILDVGQVEGAFVMGIGYYHSEELRYDRKTGLLLTDRTWTYWPPGPKDIPVDFRVTFRKRAPNPVGVYRSKATGEPPICMTMSLQHALRYALRSARTDAGISDEWFDFHQPCTYEKTLLTSGTEPDEFHF